MTSLAEFIQTHREQAGLSIYGLADRTGIDISVLEDIESGKAAEAAEAVAETAAEPSGIADAAQTLEEAIEWGKENMPEEDYNRIFLGDGGDGKKHF